MYFIVFQPEDRSYTKFVSITDKLTDDLNLAIHSMDLDFIRDKYHDLQVKDRSSNYIIFKFVS